VQPAPEPLRRNSATLAAAGYGFQEPRYTQTPNEVFTMLGDLSHPELCVLLLVIRATLGYHQTTSGGLSLTDMQKCSGLSRPAISKAARRLCRAGIITQVRKWPVSQWRLNITSATNIKLKPGEETMEPHQPGLWPLS
jgi:hypothetical protein